MLRSVLGAVVLSMLVALAPAAGQDSPDSVAAGNKQFGKRVLVSGLAGPWEITWGPDNVLWVTERSAKTVSRIDPATGARTVAAVIDEVSAPGGQDGLLGMALHPDLLRGTGNDFVYVYYTYVDERRPPSAAVKDSRGPYRFLFGKVVRFTYNKTTAKLSDPLQLIAGLPVGNDHVSGRLKIGPDRKLYLTIGDEGHNQLGNFCLPIEAQRLPTAEEVGAKNYAAYVGKSIRLNLDGSIPEDNPKLAGIVSHVYTYGHRNMQGIDFSPNGTLYASEQGPKTDDEINILRAGGNYGWPHVAGLRDGKAYEYARWAEATTPCDQLRFSDLEIPASVPRESELAYTKSFVSPIATMFTVASNFNFRDPACKGVDFLCWPTVAASSIEYYPGRAAAIPGWDRVLLITTLKRGSLYVLPLTPDGMAAAGHMSRYFQSENRYRDTAVSADGKTIYVATDPGGLTEALGGGPARTVQNKGAILAFTYEGEGTATASSAPKRSAAEAGAKPKPAVATGEVPAFTAAQASAGRRAYDSNCAVCHGSTLTNGTFAPPLGGEYFKTTWSGQTVGALFNRAKSMPPASPGSLGDAIYLEISAYILQMNGSEPGSTALPSQGDRLSKMRIR